MKLLLRMFAGPKQLLGLSQVEVDVPEQITIGELRKRLVEEYPVLLPLADHLRFSINTDFAKDDDRISATDDVACIPPVSGG